MRGRLRRRGLPGVLPDLARRLRIHRPGERGAARHPARRPRRLRPQPRQRRSRRSTATRSSSRTSITNFRIVTGSFAAESEALEQAIAELDRGARRGPPGAGQAQRRLPAAPGLRARGCCPGSGPPTRPSTTPPRGSASSARWSPRTSCAAWSRTCARRSPSWPVSPRRSLPFLEESRAALLLLQPGRHPLGQHRRPGAMRQRSTDPVYKQTGYGLVGVAGESRSGDAQGQWFRVLGSGGAATAVCGVPDRRRPGRRGPANGAHRDPARDDLLGEDPVPPRRPL